MTEKSETGGEYLRSVAIFGGSFDPVHLGHIAVADLVQEKVMPDELRFLPCNIPPHKRGLSVDSDHRLAMLRLALDATPYQIDEFELGQSVVSYTVETMREFRKREGNNVSLTFIIGFDSLCSLNTWWRWEELPELVNLVVVGRPNSGSELSEEISSWMSDKECLAEELARFPNGKVVSLPSSEKAISSSQIRHSLNLKNEQAQRAFVDSVCKPVAEYIERHQLYRGQ